MTRRNAIFTIISIILAIIASGVSVLYLRRKYSTNLMEYEDIISEIADVIIPRTDTPGAKDVGVSKFIVNFIRDCLSDRDRKTIQNGLNNVENYCKRKFSSSFIHSSPQNKIEVLEYFQDKGIVDNVFFNKVKTKLLGPSFFELIKDVTVNAYCVSKGGATLGLAYEHIPDNYVGCLPLNHDQRSWATT